MDDFPETLDIPDELMPALSMAVGQLVIAWGSIEASLNLTISVIYHEAGGKQIESAMPRTQLQRKIDFLTKCSSRIEALNPFKRDLADILNRIGGHSKIRHAVVHGYLSGFDIKTGVATFTKLDGKDDHHTVGSISGTIPELAQAAGLALGLGGELAVLMVRLSHAFPGAENKGNDPGGEGCV